MKLTKALCAALAVVFLLAAVGLAEEDPAEKPRGPRGPGQRPPGEAMLGHLTKALDLTEDQQAQIKEIFEAQRQAAENWRKEHAEELKELRKEMREAHEENDAEAIKELREKMRKLLEGRMEAGKKVPEKIAAVLTDEQKEKFEKMRGARGRPGQPGPRRPGARGPLGLLRQLDLTDEQKGQVKDIMKAAHEEAAKADDPQAKRKIMAEAFEKIRDNVLTDEQRKKLKKLHGRRLAHHPGLQRLIALAQALELTDEQKAEIKEALEAARKKIHDEVLTDEQRAKLKELLEKRPKIDRPPAGGGPPRGRPRGYGPYQKPENQD